MQTGCVQNILATSTLLLTYLQATFACPALLSSASHFGKPAGTMRLLSVRNGWVKSIPVSIIPILIPAPALDCPPSAAHKVGALISVGERFKSEWTENERV